MYPSALTEGRTTPGVDGYFRPLDALAKILDGTGLTYVRPVPRRSRWSIRAPCNCPLVNALSKPLAGLWLQTGVRTVLEPFRDEAIPANGALSSVQAAFDTAKDASPGMLVSSIVFPSAEYGSPWHYVVWAKGKKALTSRLFNPVLVDASRGTLFLAGN